MTTATISHLDTLVQRAIAAYPAEAARIERGAAIVQAGGVRWNAAGMALVASSVAGQSYPVGKRCPCYDAVYNAPGSRCQHKWAKCLASKLHHEQEAAEWLPTRYHGTYGEDYGMVAAKQDGSVWFQADGTSHWMPVSLHDVVLAGVAA